MAQNQQTADDDLAILRNQLAESQNREAAVVAENAKLKGDVGKVTADRVAADKATARTAIAAAEGQIAAAEAAIETAGKASDWAGLAKAQRAIATAQTHLDAWQGQLKRIESWEQSQAKAGANGAGANGGRAQAAPQEWTPKTKAWLDSHPDVASNKLMMERATAAHFAAVAEGLIPESPGYFEYVETKLGLKQASADDNQENEEEVLDPSDNTETETPVSTAAKEAPARSSMAAAPSRNTPPVGGKTPPGKVRLTAEEQEAARFSFPRMKPAEAYAEYAKNKVKIQEEIANGLRSA